ncbi:hypothetical protein PSEUBRA_001458 [Kalmanozyma brasiliensis GHG001]|uniref:Uncharacterized protein n=1 Tax=Kalmanozyma brasiliensis (strain GHG001) TaxID=1365824 RepID=V5GS45_KALBG|nr:uncharacterized protein PSEUBRA_001458 [Kalmanozyma brasiliensis GHG001]EST08762.1 hypothetical protein PSEUBRA_001458 [Kalmanozyma brasiliensis GHG001]
MDSAKIFALGLAAGLTIHVVLRSKARQAKQELAAADKAQPGSIAKSKKKNKKKAATTTAAPTPAPEPIKVEEKPAAVEAPAPASTASKKNKKKSKAPSQPAPTAAAKEEDADTYAEVAETTPALNNETIRSRADAAQTAFTASLGDMRDADVDALPAGYSSVARIPAPEVDAPKPKLSKKEQDDGWSSVGGTFTTSTPAAKPNGASASTNGTKSIASTNPFAALPDDATTSSVRRLPTKASKPSANGWTIASSSPKPKPNGPVEAETKKQRSNANKTQAKKAAKEEADRLQAERLANHRRQQATEAAKAREVSKRPSPQSVPGAGKQTSAKASVDLNGRLVWD